MLGEGTVMATVAVKDIAAAKAFYGETLGLKQIDESAGGVTYECGGGSKVFVYPSSFAGTNQATCASWMVTDIGAVVEDLKSRGVVFEHYDQLGPGMTREGDIHIMQSEKAAWFKDPDGNILAVSSN